LGRNRGLKLLSLLLALALWFAVGIEEPTETTLNVSLELANLPPNLLITSEVPPALQVRVVGPGSAIRKLTQTRLAQTIDLSGFKPGRHAVPLRPKSFNYPRGVTVSRVQPNLLNITLSPALTRTLQIQPVLEGKPPEGYQVVSAKTRPDQITVKGSYSEIAELKFIPTFPLDVSQLTVPTTLAADLDFKNLHLTLQDQEPILVDIAVAARIINRTFTSIPVAIDSRALRLQPAQISVTVSGPWPQVKDLKAEDIKATVDTANLAPGRHRLQVTVTLPAGLTLERLSPETVTGRVGPAPR
jgi:YbbR domain-containing protein